MRIDTLKEVDLIYSEDTRITNKLLNHLGVKTRIHSLNEHNEIKKTPKILRQLLQGKTAALVSDAGTPLISDPGYYLVKEARKNFIDVLPKVKEMGYSQAFINMWEFYFLYLLYTWYQ